MNERLILGFGNRDRGDDAAGWMAVERLGGIVIDDPVRMMEMWAGRDVVLIDAVVTGAPPGTVHVWDGLVVKLAGVALRFSTHSLGVAEAIKLSQVLGKLPRKLTIYGIEAVDFTEGSPVSEAVAAAVDRVVATARLESEGDA